MKEAAWRIGWMAMIGWLVLGPAMAGLAFKVGWAPGEGLWYLWFIITFVAAGGGLMVLFVYFVCLWWRDK